MKTLLEYINKTKCSRYGISETTNVGDFKDMLRNNGSKYNIEADKIFNKYGESWKFHDAMTENKSHVFFLDRGGVCKYFFYVYPGSGDMIIYVGFDNNKILYQVSEINRLGNYVSLMTPDNPDDLKKINDILGL